MMGIRIYIVLTLVCSALAFMRAMRSNRVLSPRSFLGDKSKTNARIVFGPGPMGSHLLHGSVALSMVDNNSADEDKVNVPVSDEVDPYKSVKEYYQNNELNMQELSTQTNEYPMNPLDAYPEDINSNDDEAVLDAMRQERQISNDLWQSTLFRDTQCKDGDWSGSYEMYCTSVGTKSDESEDDSGINLRVCDKGTVFTKMSASEFSMQGVSITASEQYTSSRPEGAKLHPSSEQALQDHGPLLLKQTRSEVGPTQWRTEAGNQIVGTCFTLGDVLPQRDLSCVDVKKDIPAEFKPTSYISEVAVQEGPTRVRVRYAYAAFPEAKQGSLTQEEQSSSGSGSGCDGYDLALVGFVVIRETQKHVTPSDLEKLLSPNVGPGIYDPQGEGEEYCQLDLSGNLSLLFPRGLKLNGFATMCMEYAGKHMRYQVDRRFVNLSGAIKTLELTEIRPEDVEQFPPTYLPVDLLK